MARYIDADKLIKQMKDGKYVDRETSFQRGVNSAIDYWITEINHFPSADVVPKSEVERLYKEIDRLSQVVLYHDSFKADEIRDAKAEVARTFRKRMNEKMGKHTHLLGKEYVQRIMREVEKELIGEEDA